MPPLQEGAHAWFGHIEGGKPSEIYPRGRAAALRALELDENLAEAHAALGYIRFAYDWDWAGAEDEFKRAIALNPNSAAAHHQYSVYLGNVGRLEEAIAVSERSVRLDPDELANTVANRLRPRLEQMLGTLPPDYFLEDGGELEETANAQGKLIRAIALSILLMILVLTVQYNSVVKPAVILFAVPMAMIGVLIGLLVTGWAMGFMAMLGILSLGGIVINNAIVLVDFIETKVVEGADLRQAIASAGRQRMRPIVLTTLTTIGALLPLSLFGGALWAPMTNGMIFGLVFSTVLTLIVVPTMYLVFVERFGMKVGAR